MADQQQQHAPGGHYSGANPVPTVRKFLENLDQDKKERDRQVEEREKQLREDPNASSGQSQVAAHKPHPRGIKGTQKEVTDPTTGRKVVIEDIKKDVMHEVDNPKVRPFFSVTLMRPVLTVSSSPCRIKLWIRTRYSLLHIPLSQPQC